MAWPVSTQTLQKTLNELNVEMDRAVQSLTSIRDASLAGPVRRKRLQNALRALAGMDAQIVIAKAKGVDMADYVKDQIGDPAFDVVAEINAVQSAGQALAAWINTNIPRSGGAVLFFDIDVKGKETELMFSTAELANFRTNVDTFLTTVA